MKKFNLRGASWDSIFLAAIRVATTLATIIETKILSVGFSLTEYGTTSQIQVVLSICNSLLLLGLGDAVNYYYNHSSGKYNRETRLTIVNTIFAIEIIAGIVVAALLFFGKNAIANYYKNTLIAPLIVFVMFRPMITNLLTLYQTLFVSVGRAKLIAIKNLVISAISISVMAISVYLLHSVRAMYICTLIVAICQLLFFAVYFKTKEFAIRPDKADFSYVKEIVAYAIPMGIYALTSTLSRDVDRLVIGYLSNTETVAIYTNCSKLLPYDIIATSFATVLIPYIMRYITGGDSRATTLFRNYLKIGYYSVVVFGVGTLLVTDQIIPFLYSSEYLAGKSVFIIYIIDSMLKFASMHLVLAANGQTKLIMKYSIITLICNAVLNVILFKLLGMIGPAIATLLVTSGYTFAILNKTRSILNTKWSELFDVKDVALFVLGLAATGAVAYLLKTFLLRLDVTQTVAMLVTLAVFGLSNLTLCRKRIRRALSAINELKLKE